MSPLHEQALGWMHQGTELFLEALESLDDGTLGEPGPLPGWTGRHVVAHVAANAEALGNLVLWARTGEETRMYSSPEQRNADIDAGSLRPVDELRRWAAASAGRLAESLDTLTSEQWAHQVRTAQGRSVPATEIAWMRCREVMVHAVDLDGAVTFADLPAVFDTALLDDITAKRSASGDGPALVLSPVDDRRTWVIAGTGRPVTVRGPLAQLTAYLSGRPADELNADEGVPILPRWL